MKFDLFLKLAEGGAANRVQASAGDGGGVPAHLCWGGATAADWGGRGEEAPQSIRDLAPRGALHPPREYSHCTDTPPAVRALLLFYECFSLFVLLPLLRTLHLLLELHCYSILPCLFCLEYGDFGGMHDFDLIENINLKKDVNCPFMYTFDIYIASKGKHTLSIYTEINEMQEYFEIPPWVLWMAFYLFMAFVQKTFYIQS